MTRQEARKYYNSATGIYSYKGYKIRPHQDDKLGKTYGVVSYLGLEESIDGFATADFAEAFKNAIDSYLCQCKEARITPVPPRKSPEENSREFLEKCRTASVEELLPEKRRICGWNRCWIILERDDLTAEEKQMLLPKNKHWMIEKHCQGPAFFKEVRNEKGG